MVRLFIPDRFLARTADEFSKALERVSAEYWYRVHTKDVELETDRGLTATGTLQAMQWLGGARDIPPGCYAARVRTRYDLLDLLRIAELACFDPFGRWESVTLGGPGGVMEYFERNTAHGARHVYEWALNMSPKPSFDELLPEQVRQARMAYELEMQRQARLRQAAEAPTG